MLGHKQEVEGRNSVAEPKLFICGSGSNSSYCHKLPLKAVLYCTVTVVIYEICLNEGFSSSYHPRVQTDCSKYLFY